MASAITDQRVSRLRVTEEFSSGDAASSTKKTIRSCDFRPTPKVATFRSRVTRPVHPRGAIFFGRVLNLISFYLLN